VVTTIPPRLREAHVAGFSAHLSTGQAHVLGVALRLPALGLSAEPGQPHHLSAKRQGRLLI